jgi:hypothetical protein
LRKIVLAYKTACHINDAETEESEDDTKSKFKIASSVVFNNLMSFCVRDLPDILIEFLDFKKK